MGQAESCVSNSVESFGNKPFSLLLLVHGGPTAHLFHAAFLSNPRKCSVQTRDHAGPSPSAWNDLCHFFSPFTGHSQSHAHICSMWWGLQSLVGGAASILSNKQFATDTQGETGSQSQLKSLPLECILFENIANRTESRGSINI